MTICANGTVAQLEARIAEMIGPKRFAIWFKNSTRLDFADQYLTVTTPNHYVGDFVERTFSQAILEAAREVTNTDYLLSFAIDPEIAKTIGRHQPDRQVDYVASMPDRAVRNKKRTRGLPVAPILRGRLDEFVVGPSNRLAYAAALGVVETPATRYNPLFIHGGCGIGKTHLLQGICNALSERSPSITWRYVSGEDFMNDYVFAVRAREMNTFHERYRHIDVLVIDDVHFLANKRATQEEFLNTVKAMDMTGKQLVLASDAHPKMIGHFSEALISRFLSGMVVRIEPPDHEVRMGVLRRRAETLKVSVGVAVLEYIAENFTANIRELEGALLKVVAHAQVSGEPITPALAQRAIRDVVRQTAPVVMLSDIESIVAIYFGLRPADLHTSRKSRTIALSRGIAMYLARKHTEMSFPEIGRFMGNKNHSTVILACRRIAAKLQNNESVSWLTPEGLKERKLDTLIAELEEQFVRSGQHHSYGREISRTGTGDWSPSSGNGTQTVAASALAR